MRSSNRFQWAMAAAGISIISGSVTRAIVFLMSDHGPVSITSFTRAFVVGAAFDILVALWLAAPWMLYLGLRSEQGFARRRDAVLRRVALGMQTAVVMFFAVAEVVFFDEFDGRFNFVAVDYLIYPTEVVTNIWQSYHVAWLVAGIAVLSAVVIRLFRAVLARADREERAPLRTRMSVVAGYVAALGVATFASSPNFQHIGDNRVMNEVASNGYYTFWQALLGRDAMYEGWYPMRSRDSVERRLAALTDTATTFRAPVVSRPLNVVVVLEESFGSTFVSSLHPRDSASITPSFDSLAAEGLLFTRAYSTGNRTIRAIEATTASLPPLPGVSIVRRPQSRNLFTLPAVLRANGYATEFIYGGRAFFDGMGSYARSNGFSRVVEQRDFPPSSYKTAWGVADEIIFDRALAEFDSLHATGKPFYSLVLTVSNHRPYTYPAGRIQQNAEEHRRVYAVRYADWALGRFVRMARTHAFFENTIFVLMGDHGARVYGAAQIPLPSYEVPLVFYNPRIFAAPRRISTMASSMDIPPTILGLLGAHGAMRFLGRDLFSEDTLAGRALMTHNNDLALMRGDRMAVLGLHGQTSVHRVDSSGGLIRIPLLSAGDRALVEDAIAYFQGADMLYRSGKYHFDSTPGLAARTR